MAVCRKSLNGTPSTPGELLAHRQKLGLSQRDYGKLHGFSASVVRKMERGEREITFKHIRNQFGSPKVHRDPPPPPQMSDMDGAELRSIRQRVGLNQHQFGSYVGTTAYHIGEYERAQKPIPQHIAEKALELIKPSSDTCPACFIPYAAGICGCPT